MKKNLSFMLAVAFALAAASPAFALDARPLVAADLPTMGGTDFDGGVGDILLRNDKVEAVILATGATPDFGIPFAAEALPAAGVIVDAGTLGDKNDQLTEIDHVLNLDGRNLVLYGGAPVLSVVGSTASATFSGIALLTVDPPGPPPPVVISSPGAPTIFATTTYSVTNGQSWINITTVIFNANIFAAPVFQVADVDITVARGPLPFQPFPFRGTKSPPLDLSSPASAIGVWSYVSVVGNNGPANGATNNDGSPSGEVNYTFTAPSVFSPLIGLASPIVTGVTTLALALAGIGFVRAAFVHPSPAESVRLRTARHAELRTLVPPDTLPVLSDDGHSVRSATGRAAVQLPAGPFRLRAFESGELERWRAAGVAVALMSAAAWTDTLGGRDGARARVEARHGAWLAARLLPGSPERWTVADSTPGYVRFTLP